MDNNNSFLSKILQKENCTSIIGESLSQKGVYVLAVGPSSCLRVLYFRSKLESLEGKLFFQSINKDETISGDFLNKTKEKLIEIIEQHSPKAVIIYITCVDIIAKTDYSYLINELENEYSIPIKLFKRGPLVKRKITPKERLKKLYSEIGHFYGEKLLIDEKQSNNNGSLLEISTDYSGVLSILYDFNSLNILFSPGGCAHSFSELDEIRNLNSEKKLFYNTNLNEFDVIYANDEELIKNIKEKLKTKMKIDFISIVGSPVSYLINYDFLGVQDSVEKPVIIFDTNGFENYQVGISSAWSKIIKNIELKILKSSENRINIIGFNNLSLNKKEYYDDVIKYFNKNRVEISFFDFESVSKNSINLVITLEGVELAEYLKNKYDIPYIINNCIGIDGINEVIKYSNLHFNIEIPLIGKEKEIKSNKKILIIDEPFRGFSIKNMLEKDFNIKEIKLISPINRTIKSKKVYKPLERKDIIYTREVVDLIKMSENVDYIIADNFFQELLEIKKENFINFPYRALSSKLYLEDEFNYIGVIGYNYIKNKLK